MTSSPIIIFLIVAIAIAVASLGVGISAKVAATAAAAQGLFLKEDASIVGTPETFDITLTRSDAFVKNQYIFIEDYGNFIVNSTQGNVYTIFNQQVLKNTTILANTKVFSSGSSLYTRLTQSATIVGGFFKIFVRDGNVFGPYIFIQTMTGIFSVQILGVSKINDIEWKVTVDNVDNILIGTTLPVLTKAIPTSPSGAAGTSGSGLLAKVDSGGAAELNFGTGVPVIIPISEGFANLHSPRASLDPTEPNSYLYIYIFCTIDGSIPYNLYFQVENKLTSPDRITVMLVDSQINSPQDRVPGDPAVKTLSIAADTGIYFATESIGFLPFPMLEVNQMRTIDQSTGTHSILVQGATGPVDNWINFNKNTGNAGVIISESSNNYFTYVNNGNLIITKTTENSTNPDVGNASALQYAKIGDSVAIGNQAGETGQSTGSVAIGLQAGETTQGANSVAIGTQTGQTGTQGASSVAIGNLAGNATQGDTCVAIGNLAGETGQLANAVAIGNQAGRYTQGNTTVAIGLGAGKGTVDVPGDGQGTNSVAIGNLAAEINQDTACVAIGSSTARYHQGNRAIAIGRSAAEGTFGDVGDGQGASAVAIGDAVARTNQGFSSIAIGRNTGNANQGNNSIAMGNDCATTNQGSNCVALGQNAGLDTQGNHSIAIGTDAGSLLGQGTASVAIGQLAGQTNQGGYAVAIGYNASSTDQHNNTIVISNIGTGAGSVTTMGVGRTYIGVVRGVGAPENANQHGMMYDFGTTEFLYNTNKTFVIEHPTKENNYLVHACIEGPEAGVYYRGRGIIPEENGKCEIILPNYVDKFATNFTVHVSMIIDEENPILGIVNHTKVKNGKFSVYGSKKGEFDWHVYAERINNKFDIEPSKHDYELNGEGPYTWLSKK